VRRGWPQQCGDALRIGRPGSDGRSVASRWISSPRSRSISQLCISISPAICDCSVRRALRATSCSSGPAAAIILRKRFMVRSAMRRSMCWLSAAWQAARPGAPTGLRSVCQVGHRPRPTPEDSVECRLSARPSPCPPSRRRSAPPTDDGHSGLVAGTGLHAPKATLARLAHCRGDGRPSLCDPRLIGRRYPTTCTEML